MSVTPQRNRYHPPGVFLPLALGEAPPGVRRERPRSPGQQPASLRPPSLALRAGSVPSGPGPAAEPLGGKVLRAEPAVWPEGGRASPVSRLFAGLAAPWRSGVHFAGPCVRMRSEGPASLCRAGLSSRPAPSAENTVLSPPNLPGALPKFLDNQSCLCSFFCKRQSLRKRPGADSCECECDINASCLGARRPGGRAAKPRG